MASDTLPEAQAVLDNLADKRLTEQQLLEVAKKIAKSGQSDRNKKP